jgi:hypothetical protein
MNIKRKSIGGHKEKVVEATKQNKYVSFPSPSEGEGEGEGEGDGVRVC